MLRHQHGLPLPLDPLPELEAYPHSGVFEQREEGPGVMEGFEVVEGANACAGDEDLGEEDVFGVGEGGRGERGVNGSGGEEPRDERFKNVRVD
jgi:hypothetical protein